MVWHTLTLEQIFSLIGTSPNGLLDEQVAGLYEKYGPNELLEKKRKPAWRILLNQFADFMIIVLVVASIISGFVGELTDTIVILVIVLLNAVIGFLQEYRAENAMAALREMATHHSVVLRNGHPVTISTVELLPGDVVMLEAGNIVPADMRLMEAHSLRIDEAALTGESVSVNKHILVIEESEIAAGDKLNMVFKGTLVTQGRGRGVVVATGMNTELGMIARMLQGEDVQTPLQARMADFGKKLSYGILVICAALFGIGLWAGQQVLPMLLLAISLAVAAIPESLPALITIALARGAKRLAKNNALIRKLPAVETLGSVTFICTDKTGTLTQNQMKVAGTIPNPIQAEALPGISLFEMAQALNHDVRVGAKDNLLGDPTELAVVESVAHRLGFDQLKEIITGFPRIAEFPFDAIRKCMTTVNDLQGSLLLLTKGAVESIAPMLNNEVEAQEILKQAAALSADGYRVLVYGFKWLDCIDAGFSLQTAECDLDYLGMVYMADPPREEISKAISECKTAGIRPVMITGDHPSTALAIASQIGLPAANSKMISGVSLNKLTPEEFASEVENISIYARVSPEQKLRIVQALQQRGQFVAMTGDGVNDAPSLKKANIGIAMGVSGTDVSKETAHMILLDDNFATIVKAVKEGRRIYDNIRKFVKYVLSCNGAEILTMFLAPLFGLPIPLLPIQILWINLVTDGLPGLALAGEKAEKNIMQRPPRQPGESLFAGGIGWHILWVACLMAAVALGTQAAAIHFQSGHWQTMVFTVLSISQLGQAMAVRSETQFIYRHGLFSNLPLVLTVLFTFVLQLVVIYLPWANQVFKTQPLTLVELSMSILLSAVVFHAVELEKFLRGVNRKVTG